MKRLESNTQALYDKKVKISHINQYNKRESDVFEFITSSSYHTWAPMLFYKYKMTSVTILGTWAQNNRLQLQSAHAKKCLWYKYKFLNILKKQFLGFLFLRKHILITFTNNRNVVFLWLIFMLCWLWRVTKKKAVCWVSSPVASPLRFQFYINEIKSPSSQIQVDFKYVEQSANVFANSLTKQGVDWSSPLKVFSL